MPLYIRPYQCYILTFFKKKVVKKFGHIENYSYLCIRKFRKNKQKNITDKNKTYE